MASAGRDLVTGKRRQVFTKVRGSKTEAERELTRLLREIDQGTLADPGRLTLSEYLRDRWLPHIATRVRARTHLRYSQLVTLHVLPRIGAVPLGKVRPVHLQQVVDAMLAAGLAPRTTGQAHRALSAALRQAVTGQLLGVNPAAAVQPPRAERAPLQVPDAVTVNRVLHAARGNRFHVSLVLAATTGMRRGEVLALKWSHVDLEAGLARVVASLQIVPGGELRFLDPKTDRARRTVALPLLAVDLLRRHRREQAERRLLLGEAWRDLDLVVDQGDGGPLSPDALSRTFYRLVRSVGLPRLRLHDLRHAYATTLLEAGFTRRSLRRLWVTPRSRPQWTFTRTFYRRCRSRRPGRSRRLLGTPRPCELPTSFAGGCLRRRQD